MDGHAFADATNVVPSLTQRELCILEALSQGADGKELARTIGRSRGTAEADIRVLYRKLDARSRHHLVARAFRLGILTVTMKTERPRVDHEPTSE
jgi:LuxR family transcriptional regulator